MEEITYSPDHIQIARFAKALSHPARIKILEILLQQTCCFSGDMCELLPIARSTLSQHLNELKNAGLIQGEIKAPKIKYCLNSENWEKAYKMFSAFFKERNKND